MSAIPLHLQRRCEQKWAARFVPPVAAGAPKSIVSKDTVNAVPRPAKEKEKPAGSSTWDVGRIGAQRVRAKRGPMTGSGVIRPTSFARTRGMTV